MQPLRLVPLLLPALLAACQSGAEDRADEVPELLRQGQYAEALRQAEKAHRQDPDDPRATEEYRLASAAVLLERGRRALFEDRDHEALALFQEAYEIAPEQPAIADWIYNASEKLALQWYRQGSASQADADLEQARADFERSLSYLPEYQRSRAALMRTLLQINYRAGLGEEYYHDGVRNLHDHLLDEADFSFSASLKYEPESELAGERRALTRAQLAEERTALALQLEGQGAFAAARNEYRMALLLDLDNAEAAAGFGRAALEEEAAEHLSEAEWRIMRKEYDQARAELAAGAELTEQQTEGYERMHATLDEALLGDIYDRAKLYQSDQQYEQAIATYTELLDQAPYFKDAFARRDALQDYVKRAEELYAQALAEPTPEEQAKYLLQIATFWPEYRDVAERLAALDVAEPR
jgi:tetratricopeptide (TPR) repeat protein